MQYKTASETQRGNAANKCVQRLRGRSPFSNGPEGNLAVHKQDNAMSEALGAAQNPSQVSNQRRSLLNVDVVGRLNADREDHVEVAKLKSQVVARTKASGQLGGQSRPIIHTNVSPCLTGHASDLAHFVNASLGHNPAMPVLRGSVCCSDEREKG